MAYTNDVHYRKPRETRRQHLNSKMSVILDHVLTNHFKYIHLKYILSCVATGPKSIMSLLTSQNLRKTIGLPTTKMDTDIL